MKYGNSGLQGVQLTGVGKAVPEFCLTNDQFAQVIDTSDEWIYTRTGIKERRVLALDETVLDLALRASQQALAQAGLVPEDLEMVILATSTPEDLFGTASLLATRLGATRAFAFDLTAACTGFVFALATAAQFIRTGSCGRALVVAADGLTRFMDWRDRSTCVLFGDGAGAVVLEQSPVDQILGMELRSDGRNAGMLNIAASGPEVEIREDLTIRQNAYQPISMNGREVYRFAVTAVPDVIEKALHRADIDPHTVRHYFLHQANQRILDAVAERLGVPRECFPSTLAHYANTSAASIPITMEEWITQGLLQPSELMVLAGFGAGLTWGAVVCRWGRVA
ncbi:beta-ketoacyl-ACP synthase III [Anthocerotibacter panamensis]|uniref:beta-ketoacyl-ACP synthase III n=1 Tax=Anthocerotibacter panamensis TaxID=2857077 RepID=UPI001C407A3A|nr:beta-ketoacyl-ACP synthase III [Anthocerotibacter panamensis]